MSTREYFLHSAIPGLLMFGIFMSVKDSPPARRWMKREWRKLRRRLGLKSVSL